MNRTTQHSTFVIERRFDAPVAMVFKAWADPVAKARWFSGPPQQWTQILREHDFRVGGRERLKGSFAGGPVSSFDCLFQDIVPESRIVYTYDMHLDDKRISVSLATIEFRADDAGTVLVVTEQGVFLDGYDDSNRRETGTRALLDGLEAALRQG